MNKYVYKITNLINNKVYIGQSNNPIRRFKEHINGYNYTSLISQAIKKYGENNFYLDILYYGEDYNNKEKFFIKKYETLNHNKGYNIMEGGEDPPINSHTKFKKEDIEKIRLALIMGMDKKEIHNIFPQITMGQLTKINKGTCWKDNNLKYPLQENFNEIPLKKVELIIKDIKENKLTLKEIGEKWGYCKSAIVLINQGETNTSRKLEKIFPIRKIPLSTNKGILTNDQIKNIHYDLLNTKFNNAEIAFKNGLKETQGYIISEINQGKILAYKLSSFNYPIRTFRPRYKNNKYNQQNL